MVQVCSYSVPCTKPEGNWSLSKVAEKGGLDISEEAVLVFFPMLVSPSSSDSESVSISSSASEHSMHANHMHKHCAHSALIRRSTSRAKNAEQGEVNQILNWKKNRLKLLYRMVSVWRQEKPGVDCLTKTLKEWKPFLAASSWWPRPLCILWTTGMINKKHTTTHRSQK